MNFLRVILFLTLIELAEVMLMMRVRLIDGLRPSRPPHHFPFLLHLKCQWRHSHKFVSGSLHKIHFYIVFLAASGALIAIPTFHYYSTTPLFQITPVLDNNIGLSSKAITGLICRLHVYLMCKIVQDSAR